MHPYHHAESTAKKWGGKPADYQPIHDWFDETKAHFADFRHRALRHHSEGIFLCESIFGVTVTNSDGRAVPVRIIGEQHVKEDVGRIPTVKDWLENIQPAAWMMRSPPPTTEPTERDRILEDIAAIHRLHAAAPALLKALKKAKAWLDTPAEWQYSNQEEILYEEINAAIALTEPPKETTTEKP